MCFPLSFYINFFYLGRYNWTHFLWFRSELKKKTIFTEKKNFCLSLQYLWRILESCFYMHRQRSAIFDFRWDRWNHSACILYSSIARHQLWFCQLFSKKKMFTIVSAAFTNIPLHFLSQSSLHCPLLAFHLSYSLRFDLDNMGFDLVHSCDCETTVFFVVRQSDSTDYTTIFVVVRQTDSIGNYFLDKNYSYVNGGYYWNLVAVILFRVVIEILILLRVPMLIARSLIVLFGVVCMLRIQLSISCAIFLLKILTSSNL